MHDNCYRLGSPGPVCIFLLLIVFADRLQGLDEAVDKAEVITQLVADGQDNLAQLWVTALGRDYQVQGSSIACSSSSSSRSRFGVLSSSKHRGGATAFQLHVVATSRGSFCASLRRCVRRLAVMLCCAAYY
jgi:hypothetical protein